VFTDKISEESLARLICHAHAHDVRVVPHIGSEILTLSDRTSFIEKWYDYIQSHHMDGINIDAEDPVDKDSMKYQAMKSFLMEIFNYFKSKSSHYQISFDVAWSPSCIDGRCYDYQYIGQWTDLVIVMAYDERSQVFDDGPCLAGANSDIIKTQAGINDYIHLGIKPYNLILGLPWYGYDYPCLKLYQHDLPCEIPPYTFRGVNCSDGIGKQLAYADIVDNYLPHNVGGVSYNQTAECPFFTYVKDGSTSHQIWFDNPDSLSVKYKYAKNEGLRGLAFWNIDQLNYNSNDTIDIQRVKDMWNAILEFVK
jgi:di-N-acetylchitobiase